MAVMRENNITSSLAYQFWNDCCERDIDECWRVLDALVEGKISKETFVDHIDRPRGIPFEKEFV